MSTALQLAARMISVPANGDLSSKQFHFVNVNSSGKLVAASAGGRIAGVLVNDPDAANEPGSLQIEGVAQVVAGDTVAAGDGITADSAGKAVTAAGDDIVGGIALTGASSGEYVAVLLGGATGSVATVGGYLDTALATGALATAHLLDGVFFSIDGAKSAALAAGVRVGQILELHCGAVANIPDGSVTGTFLTQAGASATSLAFNAAGDFARLMWTGAAWRILALNSVTAS